MIPLRIGEIIQDNTMVSTDFPITTELPPNTNPNPIIAPSIYN
jgi:hypothetical protein